MKRIIRKSKKIQYAVVGLGHIAQVAVLPAFRRSKNSKLVALVSGDKTKLRVLGKRYKVDHALDYKEYGSLLDSGTVDAVYISLPNRMHEKYAILAAKKGIHVLCEKPITVDSVSANHIQQVALQTGVKFMVAYRLHFDPASLRAIQIANSGKIGEARYFTSEFGFILRKDNIRALPDEGGSSLHDIGIYCINAARGLFKAEPVEVFAMGVSPDSSPSRIIQTVAATLRFPGDRLASFTVSFSTAEIANYRIVGTKGTYSMSNAYEYVGKREHLLTIGDKKKRWHSKIGDQFASELAYFSNCIKNNLNPEPNITHGIRDLKIIEALEQSIQSGKSILIPKSFKEIRRADMHLAIQRPRHRKPQLIHVKSASK